MEKRKLYQDVLAEEIDKIIEIMVEESNKKNKVSASFMTGIFLQTVSLALISLENYTEIAKKIVFSPLTVNDFKEHIRNTKERAEEIISDNFMRDRAISLLESLLDSF